MVIEAALVSDRKDEQLVNYPTMWFLYKLKGPQ